MSVGLYSVLDPTTGLVHRVAAEVVQGSHARMPAYTWCSIDVGDVWARSDDEPVSCLHCVSEIKGPFVTWMA